MEEETFTLGRHLYSAANTVYPLVAEACPLQSKSLVDNRLPDWTYPGICRREAEWLDLTAMTKLIVATTNITRQRKVCVAQGCFVPVLGRITLAEEHTHTYTHTYTHTHTHTHTHIHTQKSTHTYVLMVGLCIFCLCEKYVYSMRKTGRVEETSKLVDFIPS